MDSMNHGSCEQKVRLGLHRAWQQRLPRVHNQVILLGKALTAFLADVGSLAGVKLAVRDQMTLERKGAPALLADKGSLSAMDTRVGQQVVLEGEALLALLALIRSLRGVQQQVRVETVLVREALAAVGADVGAFTCGQNETIRPAPWRIVSCQEQEQPPVCTRAWVVR